MKNSILWASLVAQMVKESANNAGDLGLTPGSGRSPGEGNSYPLQYSFLENSLDRGSWCAIVHGGCNIWMWELDHKDCWISEKWCFQMLVVEKTLETPLDCREIKPVNPKGYQYWIFIGRTDAEAEAPISCSPEMKSQLIGKDPEARKDWWQEEKEATEDEIVGLTIQSELSRIVHWLNEHEFEQTPGESETR